MVWDRGPVSRSTCGYQNFHHLLKRLFSPLSVLGSPVKYPLTVCSGVISGLRVLFPWRALPAEWPHLLEWCPRPPSRASMTPAGLGRYLLNYFYVLTLRVEKRKLQRLWLLIWKRNTPLMSRKCWFPQWSFLCLNTSPSMSHRPECLILTILSSLIKVQGRWIHSSTWSQKHIIIDCNVETKWKKKRMMLCCPFHHEKGGLFCLLAHPKCLTRNN